MEERNCGNCIHCDKSDMDMVCINDESEYAADFVYEDHVCECWEGEDDE